MSKIPPYLQPGNTIGMVCPAGFMPIEKVQSCIRILEGWGYRVKLGKTIGMDNGTYFSGTDQERLDDLQEMMDGDDVHAVLCARGGYGLGRIIEKISFRKFKKHPKWIIGFSDITILHNHLQSHFDIASLHAPMAAAFEHGLENNIYLKAWKKNIEGKNCRYVAPGHAFNRKGEVIARMVGGNLSLIAHSIGTSSDIKTKGKILFLEDVGEYLYNVDRMMWQLKRSGMLKGLAGLVVGGFTDMKDTTRPFGATAEEIIRDVVKEYDYPVCFGFPISHEKENYAVKIGVSYRLKITRTKVLLEE